MKYPLQPWEGPIPPRSPDLGHNQYLFWTDEDRYRFDRMLRAEFPNILIYERLLNSESHAAEKPELRIVERLDETRLGRSLVAIFPDPAWKPELVFRGSKGVPDLLRWDFDRYWSPIITISTRRRYEEFSVWRDQPTAPKVESWAIGEIQTSYRRIYERERLIQARVLRLARKLGRNVVGVWWDTCDEFRSGRGFVTKSWMRCNLPIATPSAIEWMRAEPGRRLGMSINFAQNGRAFFPPEDVPEHVWRDYPKPKWAVEAIAKHSAQTQAK